MNSRMGTLARAVPAGDAHHRVRRVQRRAGVAQGRGVDDVADAGGAVAHLLAAHRKRRLRQVRVMRLDVLVAADLVHRGARADEQAGFLAERDLPEALDALDVDHVIRFDQPVAQLDDHVRAAVEEHGAALVFAAHGDRFGDRTGPQIDELSHSCNPPSFLPFVLYVAWGFALLCAAPAARAFPGLFVCSVVGRDLSLRARRPPRGAM